MKLKQILYLREEDVARCITPKEAVRLAEEGIKADGSGLAAGDKFYMQVGDQGFIKPFSGYLTGEDYAYVKIFNFFEGNRLKDMPVTDSMVILYEADTGMPVCIMEANWITGMKTGASTAVTAKYLANADSKVLTIFGAGSLGRMHLICLDQVFSMEDVRIVDLIPEKADEFAVEMGEKTGLPIMRAQSPEEAVRDADIVITVTTGSAVNVAASWLKPGAFVARLGSYQEIDQDLLLEADKLVVDRWEYVNYRVPEMVELIDAGRLTQEDVHAEWPDIIAGKAAGREAADETILFIALGIWGEYAAILPHVYRRALELGLGSIL